MFDFAWSEFALIGVVALIAIGPKDMPVAIKTMAQMVKKARRMASEFQGHVDEMVREANLHEVRDQFNEIRRFNVRGALERAVDNDGSIRRSFSEDPFKPAAPLPEPQIGGDPASATGDVAVLARDHPVESAPLVDPDTPYHPPDPIGREPVLPPPAAGDIVTAAPAFIPPEDVAARALPPPAFIPPDAVRSRRSVRSPR